MKASAGSLLGPAHPDFLAEFGPEDVRAVLASLPGCVACRLLVYVERFLANDVSRMLDGRWRPSEYLAGTVGAEDRVLLEEHLGALPALLRRAGARPVAQRSHNEQAQPGSWFAPDPRAFATIGLAT